MRATKIILASLAIGGSLSTSAQGAADLAGKLAKLSAYSSDATFEVLLPSAEDPIVYEINLQSEAPASTDSLAPCNYLIRWETNSSAGPVAGFSAYFDGNHYRYRNNRLQEYHSDANIDTFLPQGPGSKRLGVQSTAQFADLIPQFLAGRILDIINDDSYIYTFTPDTLVNKHRSSVIEGVKRGDGYDVMRFCYVFDYDTSLPVSTEIESGLGSISEQIMNVNYHPSTLSPIAITEEGLMENWPEVFEKYRQSTFKAENLVNTPLPTFACQTLYSDERHAHHTGESLGAATLVVFLDPEVATLSDTMKGIREAVDMAPMEIAVIWAFNDNRSDDIAHAVGKMRDNEKTIISAGSLIRNCGITLYPTTLIVNRDGIVKDVLPGYNKDLSMIVLQKAALL